VDWVLLPWDRVDPRAVGLAVRSGSAAGDAGQLEDGQEHRHHDAADDAGQPPPSKLQLCSVTALWNLQRGWLRCI
jgi:hypothetical protein